MPPTFLRLVRARWGDGRVEALLDLFRRWGRVKLAWLDEQHRAALEGTRP